MRVTNIHVAFGGLVLASACTQTYDDFNFDSGGTGAGTTVNTGPGGTGTGAMGTGASGAVGGMGTGGGGQGGEGVGGTTTVGGGGPGGTGGFLGDPGVVGCGDLPCSVNGNGKCCWQLPDTNICKLNGNCSNGQAEITCDGPEDCGGDICCGTLDDTEFSELGCDSRCDNSDEFTICHVGDDSPCGGGACVQSPFLDSGYGTCL